MVLDFDYGTPTWEQRITQPRYYASQFSEAVGCCHPQVPVRCLHESGHKSVDSVFGIAARLWQYNRILFAGQHRGSMSAIQTPLNALVVN